MHKSATFTDVCGAQQSKPVLMSSWLTHANGDGDKVDEPEQDILSMEAHSKKDAGGDDERHKQDDQQLLHHLGQKVRDAAVQPIAALPAQIALLSKPATTM